MSTPRYSLDSARRRLAELQRKEFALKHASGALEFDAATTAPPGSVAARAVTQGALGDAALELLSSSEGVFLLDFLADNIEELPPGEARELRLLLRKGEILRSITLEGYNFFRKLASAASHEWGRARRSGDFSELEPLLSRLFAAARHIAAMTRPDGQPYDFWLDYYEEGLSQQRCDEIFSGVLASVSPLLARARSLPAPDRTLLCVRVPPLAQQRIAHANMAALGVDMSRCRLALSDRAFTVAFSKYDVRVCTRYIPESFTTSLYGVIHECGHALYELNTAGDFQFTSLGSGVSMGVHECIARFYENMIGRSPAWTRLMWPALVSNIPALGSAGPEKFFRAANAFRPSALRTDADELSYCFHIMLRYALERDIMSGELSVHDAPARWDELSEKLLGFRPGSAAEGILQDPHWASGQIGYFPAYALGSVGAAQLYARISESVDIDGCIERGDIAPVNSWMEEHIWRHGALYPPRELMARALGGLADVKYYAGHLARRMGEVYGTGADANA